MHFLRSDTKNRPALDSPQISMKEHHQSPLLNSTLKKGKQCIIKKLMGSILLQRSALSRFRILIIFIFIFLDFFQNCVSFSDSCIIPSTNNCGLFTLQHHHEEQVEKQSSIHQHCCLEQILFLFLFSLSYLPSQLIVF